MAHFSQRPYDVPIQGMQSQMSLPSAPSHASASRETLSSQALSSHAPRGSDDSKRSKGLSLTGLLGRKTSAEKTTKTGDIPKKRGPKPDSKPAVNRRQELNRQAQRTHRERKELYTKGLENQIVDLKNNLKTVESERDRYQQENRILKDLLRVNGIPFIPTPATIDDLPLRNNMFIASNQATDTNWNGSEYKVSANDRMDSTSPATTAMSFNNASSRNDSLSAAQTPTYNSPTNSSGHVNTAPNSRYTSTAAMPGSTPMDASSQATAMFNGNGLSQTSPTGNLPMATASSAYNGNPAQHQAHHQAKALGNQISAGQTYLVRYTSYGAPGIDHDQIGIDFVLALEESCQDHAAFMMKRAVDTTSTELSGHALMMSCPSHDEIMHHIDNPDLPFPHKMPDMPPHDLNRMMMNSANMDLGGEVTPVMALKMMRADERYDLMSIGELNDIKEQLKVKSRCYGFGAVLEEYEVRDVIDQIMGDRVAKLQEERSNRVVGDLRMNALGLSSSAQNHNTGQNYNNGLNYSPNQDYDGMQNYDTVQDFDTGASYVATQNFTQGQDLDNVQNYSLGQNIGSGQTLNPALRFDPADQFNRARNYNIGQHPNGGQHYAGGYI